ncbi:hypothetical protein I5U77_03095 [Stenotrophomonas maltophilia]|uniref:hypothetical protein n=2 Tax=Stenotrophomonas TaxID=40323 RepID=UPI0013DA7CF5|nr:hypothetical protein [Stenotrophomonas maltophilia]MBH1591437.1 hypothetical protein [Stenotrophomonas maltophilia]
MNTTMADGAEQRLDAQIAEALFGQPGMSKMDVANRVRELRGDGPALLVPREAGQDERARFEAWYVGNAFDYEKNPIGSRECSLMWKAWQAGLATRQTAGREPVGYLYDWTHSSALGRGEETFTAFTPDIEAARGSKGAVNIRPVYAAQPSPGGQGESMSISDDDRAVLQRLQDALPTAGISGWAKGVEVLERLLRDSLAARQPVGVPADTLRALADRWASDRDYTGSPVDDIRALIDAPTFARQPEGATVKDSLTIAARQPVGEPVEDDAASEAFGEFADDYLTDGNGYAPASTYAACSKAFEAAWPDRAAATAAARAELKRLHGDDRTVGARRAEALNRADARDDAADAAAPPAQAVDLGKILDQIAQQWEGCNYDAVGETIDIGQAIRAAGKRLIDSQAVGNG